MTLKGEAIIDGLAGLSKSFTDELNELKNELYDSHGNSIMSNPENIGDLIQKSNRYYALLQKRKELWTAKLN